MDGAAKDAEAADDSDDEDGADSDSKDDAAAPAAAGAAAGTEAAEESIDLVAAASTAGKGQKRGIGLVGKIRGFSIPAVKRPKTVDSGKL